MFKHNIPKPSFNNDLELEKFFSKENIQELKAFYEKNPNSLNNRLNLNGEIALYLACQFGNLEGVKFLLDKGAKWQSIKNYSPLLIAISHNHVDIVKYLVEWHKSKNITLDLNAESSQGKTPLLAAIENDNSELVSFLISAGADYNYKNTRGQLRETPLHSAVRNKKYKIAEMLINLKDIDFEVKNHSGKTPMDIVNNKKNKENREIASLIGMRKEKMNISENGNASEQVVSQPSELTLPFFSEKRKSLISLEQQAEMKRKKLNFSSGYTGKVSSIYSVLN